MIMPFFQRLERSWGRLIWSAVFAAVLAVGVSLALPWQYSSTMRLLVVQANVAGLDPYTALKSTEQIASSIRELVYTSLVSNQVLSGADGVNVSYFSADEYKRRQQWEKTIEVSVVPGTGILTLTAYHPSREQARLLVEGVSRQVIEQTPNFGYNAQARVIDTPLPSRWLARPNLLKNAAFGAVIGLGLAIISLFVGQERERRRGK